MDDATARELAKWDVVVLDMEAAQRSPQALVIMRQLHPDIKILAYVPAVEVRQDANLFGAAAPMRTAIAQLVRDAWYVVDTSGTKRSFWSGNWMMNVTDLAPLVDGQRWNDVFPQFIHDRILANDAWDGVMFDNAWENITFFAHGAVDLDRDGRSDAVATSDAAWRTGLKKLFDRTRTLNPGKLVFENDGPLYADHVQGVQFENFPNGGWANVMQRMKTVARSLIDPRVLWVNNNTANTGAQNNFRLFRYGLGSALLQDAFYGFDFGDRDHGQTWWYDEYNTKLGSPVGNARRLDGSSATFRAGLWRRDFTNGVVFVNTTTQTKTVQLSGVYEHISGTQDAAVNTGALTRSITLAANDAVILLRPLGEVRGTEVMNGDVVSLYRQDGSVARKSFFVTAPMYPDHARLLTHMVAGQKKEIVVSDQGTVRVFGPGGAPLIATLRPFGNDAHDVHVAYGDVQGDGEDELVLTGADGGGGRVFIYRFTGQLLRSFRAFGDTYRGGESVAVGDVSGDARAEIIVGAGAGAGPQVRVFDGFGVVQNSFFAYDPAFHGGISVAVVKDASGRGVIVTSPGAGSAPEVRLFHADGQRINAFFAGDTSDASGIRVGAGESDPAGGQTIFIMK